MYSTTRCGYLEREQERDEDTKKRNWGILGQGAIAVQMVEAPMKEHDMIYVVAKRHMEKVAAPASTYTAERCYDIESLLVDEQVDIVYIVTPHTCHYDYMMRALQRGRHVLYEKAIIVNHRQLQEVMTSVQKKRLTLMKTMTIFRMPVSAKVEELVEQGVVGKLKIIQTNFGGCKEYDVTNRFSPPQFVGGVPLDTGTYALSFVRWFLRAQPDTILANMIPFETGVDEMSGIILRNPLDEMAMVTLTVRTRLPKVGTVAGEEGYLEIREYPGADSL